MKQKIVALTLSLVCMAQTALATTLQETTNHWAKDYIEACVASGYMGGDDQGNFNPNNQMTYGEFSVVIVNGYYGGKTSPKSTDTHWADPYLNVLIDDGLFVSASGYNYGQNSSDTVITRMAVAVTTYNLMNRGSGFIVSTEVTASSYTDLQNIVKAQGQSYLQDVLNVIANGIMTGSDGEFNLNGKLTRAEAAVIFVGMKDKGVFDGKATGSSSSSNTTTGTTSTPSTSTGTVTTPSVSTPSVSTPSVSTPSTSTSKPSDVVLGSGQYNVAQYNVPADTNKDGWITYSEVEAVFAQLQEEYPQGTPWTDDNSYTSNLNVVCWVTTNRFSGCAAFAWLVSDRIFGDLPIRRVTADLNVDAKEQIRPGDAYGTTAHWNFIIGDHWNGSPLYYNFGAGNDGSQVVWDGGGNTYDQALSLIANGSHIYYYTRYPEA